MKKHFLFTCMAVIALLMGACNEEENLKMQDGNAVTFNISASQMSTRVVGEGKQANKLYWGVYDHEGKLLPDISNQTGQSFTGSDKVRLTLAQDKSYSIIFWAANADNSMCTVDWGKRKMTVNPTEANQEAYDAFCAYVEIDNISGYSSRDVKLYRPFAQLNIGTADYDKARKSGLSVVNTMVEIEGLPTEYDFVTGKASDGTKTTFTYDYPTPAVDVENDIDGNGAKEVFPVEDATYDYLSMNYLLVGRDPQNPKELVTVTFKYIDDDGQHHTRTYSSVPVQRNWRTNIYGNILTSEAEFTVTIVPEFADEYNPNDIHNIKVWDGKNVEEPTIDGNTVTIVNGYQLAWLAASVNGTLPVTSRSEGEYQDSKDYEGYTIVLGENIDLGGEAWTPIASNGKLFKGTFDGNGHTISNLNVSTEKNASAGLFATSRGTIKNLIVKDAKVYGHYKTGVIVGDGMCAKIENCHVENAEVVSTPYNKDDANHVAGIVGYLSAEPTAYVKNSTVKSTVITGFRDVAGIAGTANGASVVSGNKVESVTITADQTAEYVSNEKDGNAGTIAGRIHANAKMENNTVGENVTVIRKVDSTKEMEYAVADAQNGDIIYVGNGEVALPHFTGKALKFIGIHEDAAIAEPVSSHIDEFWKGSSLSFENLNIKGTSYTGAANGYVKSAKEEYTNCKFVDGYYMFSGDVTTVTGCTFTGKFNSYFWTGSADDITFTDCQFNGVERIVKVCTVGHTGVERNVTFNGCSFTATELKKAAIEIDGSKGSSYIVNINNCTETGFAAGELTGETMFNIEGADKVTVYVNGYKWLASGQLEDAQGNLVVTSKEGFEAALSDANVTTIYLAEGEYGTIVAKSNKTIIGSENAKVDCVNLNGAANLTLKNIKFDAATAKAAYDKKGTSGTLRQYANIISGGKDHNPSIGARNLTIEGCTFTGTFADGGAAIAFVDRSRPTGGSGNITITGCTFATKGAEYDIYGYYTGAGADGPDFIIEDNTFNTDFADVPGVYPVYLGRYQSSTPVVVKGNAFKKVATFEEAAYIQAHSTSYTVSFDASGNTFAL